jgi:hypothetical protein
MRGAPPNHLTDAVDALRLMSLHFAFGGVVL